MSYLKMLQNREREYSWREVESFHDRIDEIYRGRDEKYVANTLDFNMYHPDRRGGNTTKQIDYAIDALFNGCLVICLDHYEAGMNRDANIRMMRLIVSRLLHEHHLRRIDIKMDEGRYTLHINPSVIPDTRRNRP